MKPLFLLLLLSLTSSLPLQAELAQALLHDPTPPHLIKCQADALEINRLFSFIDTVYQGLLDQGITTPEITVDYLEAKADYDALSACFAEHRLPYFQFEDWVARVTWTSWAARFWCKKHYYKELLHHYNPTEHPTEIEPSMICPNSYIEALFTLQAMHIAYKNEGMDYCLME